MGRFGRLAVTVAIFLGSFTPILFAATERELAAEVGQGRDAGWAAVFGEQLASLAKSARVSPAAYDIALLALSDTALGGSAADAAHQVFSMCLRVDRALRRGRPPGEVLLEARETAHLASFAGGGGVLRGSAGDRIQARVKNMGGQISSDMANRFGQQGGLGAGMTAGTPGRGLPEPSSGTGGGSGSPKH